MSEKKDYEIAIEQFNTFNAEYLRLQEYVEGGGFFREIISTCQGSIEQMQEQWKILWNQLRVTLENRNTALKTAQNALRQAVQLAPTQIRGDTGKPTVITEGTFTSTSVTKRWFDGESLLKLAGEHGLAERLLEIEAINKDGERYKIVKPTYEVDYAEVLKWIRTNHLEDLMNAYDEKESTPQVKGPKSLAFLGEKKE